MGLRLRSAWNTLTQGSINSIQDEPAPKKQWSMSEWISNFLRDDHMYYGDADYDDNYLPENDPMPGGDADGMYDDIIDDGIVESILIIVLAAALVFLTYYRQQRQQAHRRDNGLFPQPGDPDFGQWVAGGVGH